LSLLLEATSLLAHSEDYELVQNKIRSQGFSALTGRMGIYIQPRTKGAGHGSTSRAFYARIKFVETILGIREA
jgi:hypothetical protein